MTVTDPEQRLRNPTWSRDELILALDLYVRFKGNPPGKSSPEIVGLSSLLNRITGGSKGGDFRNPNGVYMKMMNFRRFDPIYQAQGKTGLTRGNRLEETVWNDFATDPPKLKQLATTIGAHLDHNTSETDNDEITEIEEAEEGKILTRAHLVRERSRKLVEAKKASVFTLNRDLGLRSLWLRFRDNL
jgi:5-methylcytosine-specific restriction protein A